MASRLIRGTHCAFLLCLGTLLLGAAPAARAQYCTTGLHGASYPYGCTYYHLINDVQLNTLRNDGSGCIGGATSYYANYTAAGGSLTTVLDQGVAYPLRVSGGSSTGFAAWLDYNNDGDFNDADEYLGGTPIYNQSGLAITITIPPNAAYLGARRLRVRSMEYYAQYASTMSCTALASGETEDYTVTIASPTALAYASSTAATPATGDAMRGPNNQILRVAVAVTGSTGALSLTSFTLNSTGTTNFGTDVSNVKVYATGTSDVFATTTLFGSAASLAAPIAGTRALTSGINYFWVCYDVTATATVGNFLDAQCLSLTVGGVARTPTVTNPAGNRRINYCVPNVAQSWSNAWLNSFSLGPLNNALNGYPTAPPNYTWWPASGATTGSFELGTNYPISASGGYSAQGWAAWIDFNNDGDFADADECVWNPGVVLSPASGVVSIPANPAYLGVRRLRVRVLATNGMANTDACTDFTYGETEDYSITLVPATTPMAFASATTAQPITAEALKGSVANPMLRIEVRTTSGGVAPLALTSLTLNATGSTNFAQDVAAVKVYSTGTNPAFSEATLFGSAASLAAPITGSQVVSSVVSYFWVAYDLKPGAQLDDLLDAECTSLTLGGVARTPTLSAPIGSRPIDYCRPGSLYSPTYGCNGVTITHVSLVNLSNTTTGCNGPTTGGYARFAPTGALTTSLELGATYPLRVEGGAYAACTVWLDFNNDGDFTDAGELLAGAPSNASGVLSAGVTLPSYNPAFVGPRRLRVRKAGVASLTNANLCDPVSGGETEDYTVSVEAPTPMTLVAVTPFQPSTAPAVVGSTGQAVLGVRVQVSGTQNPLTLKSLVLNALGSTAYAADVAYARVYYSGASATFQNATVFGAATTLADPIRGTQILGPVDNYFWLTYDVRPTATAGNLLDAQCTAYTLVSGGGPAVSPLDPLGSRSVQAASATCQPPAPSSACSGPIYKVQINTLLSNSGCVTGSYTLFPATGATTTTLTLGTTYSLSLSTPGERYGIWLDANADGDFDDAGELLAGGVNYNFNYSLPLTLASDPALIGVRRLRVRSKRDYDGAVFAATGACAATATGETEDYWLTLQAPCAVPAAVAGNTTVGAAGACAPDASGWTHYSAAENPGRVVVSLRANGNALGTVQASAYVEAAPGTFGTRRYLSRHFTITPAQQPTTPVRVRLYFTPDELADLIATGAIAGLTELGITQYDGPTVDGTLAPADATSLRFIDQSAIGWGTAFGATYAEFDVTGFSEFWLHGGTTPLPVELISFEAAAVGGRGRLRWRTAQERDNAGYTVEAATDARTWTPILREPARGAPGQGATYEAWDPRPLTPGTRYYRLAQHDYDGTVHHSAIRTITGGGTHAVALTAQPNPFRDQCTVQLTTPAAGPAILTLVDALGRLVEARPLAVSAGAQTLTVGASAWPPGLYLLTVQAGEATVRLRLLKE